MTVENLSHLVGPYPTTSQSAGNTTSDQSAAQSAPGSASEGAATPHPWTGMDIPAVSTPTVMHPTEPGAPSPDPWTHVAGRPWVEGSDESPGGGNAHQAGPWRQA